MRGFLIDIAKICIRIWATADSQRLVMVRKFFALLILFVLAACGDESHPTAPTKDWPTLTPSFVHLKVGEWVNFSANHGFGEGHLCPVLIANRPSTGPDPHLFMRLDQIDSLQWRVRVTKSPQEVYTGGAVPDPYEVFFWVLGGTGLCSQRPIGNSIGEARIYIHQ